MASSFYSSDGEGVDGVRLSERAILITAISQLRQAYALLNAETVTKQKEFARGLLGPQIEKLERLADVDSGAWE